MQIILTILAVLAMYSSLSAAMISVTVNRGISTIYKWIVWTTLSERAKITIHADISNLCGTTQFNFWSNFDGNLGL